jgi:hypothetical protein
LLTPTHAQLYFIKEPFKKLLHVSVYDHLQGVTISSLKSQLFKHSCMYTSCGGVAAYHVVCIGLCLWSVRVCVFLPALCTGKNTHTRTLHKHKPIQTTRYAATPPHLVYIQLCLNNSDFSEDIVTP